MDINLQINSKLLAHNGYFIQFLILLWKTKTYDLLFIPCGNLVAIKVKPVNDYVAFILHLDYQQLKKEQGIIDHITLDHYKILIFQIKLATEMNLLDNIPQSKALTIYINNQQHSVRLSLHPTTTYNSLSMRMIRPIMFDDHQQFPNLKPGLNLILGTTCSGKTTFLYNFLEYLSCNNYTVISIEDPVEKNIPSIMQTSVPDNSNYDVYIKSALRQNPDVIVIGEIRDQYSAKGAIQASLSGHIVLATMHSKINTNPETTRQLCQLRLEELDIPQYYTKQLLETIITCEYSEQNSFKYKII